MLTGTVKWFNPTKGFGFIIPDGGGPDAYVHYNAVHRAGLRRLRQGQRVDYELVVDPETGKMTAENLVIRG
jgi:CspA family cold shock protein